MGGAFADTGRLASGVYHIHTVIAFNGLVRVWIELWYVPWAGSGTCHTTDTFFLVHVDYAVLPLYHGLCWADRHTKRVITMVTGAETEFGLWHSFY